MTGFLFDEQLPRKIRFTPSFPVIHSTTIGKSPSDTVIFKYAEEHDLTIVTKDTDFSERIILASPPPRVIHLKFGNMRKNDFHEFLEKIWPRLETLIQNHKLINVYRDRKSTRLNSSHSRASRMPSSA